MAKLSSAERRQQLLAATREACLRYGADGASLQRITEIAGVNTALVYQHFSSNVELFEHAILKPLEEEFVGWMASTERRLAAATDDAKWFELHCALLELMVAAAPMIGVVLFASKIPGRVAFVVRIKPRVEEWLGTTVASLQRLPKGDRKFLVSALWGAHFSVALDAALQGEELDIPTVAGRICDTFTYGLFERTGPRRRAR